MKHILGVGIGIVVILLTATTSCVSAEESGVPTQRLSAPGNHYNSIVRFPDGRVLIGVGSEPSYVTQMARYYSLQEERFVEIDLPDDPRCRRTEYVAATALPNGDLGYSMICSGYWSERPIGQDNARFIVAYDWETNAFEQIVEAPLPVTTWSPSWNPGMTRGVVTIGSLLGTIAWITPQTMIPMTVTVGTGEQSWSLAENLVVMDDYRAGDDRSGEVGIARNPAWSPDGRFIAFWASTNVIGRSGISRARGIYSLYLLDPDTLQLRQILDDVQNMTLLAWSPNSQWLAFTGDIRSSKNSLWIVSIDGNDLGFVDRGSRVESYPAFNDWHWLNNTEVIATRCVEEACENTEILLYEVESLIQSEEN